MSELKFQQWLNKHSANIGVDGQVGPETETAALKLFSNKKAERVTEAEVKALAARFGASVAQIKTVAHVESRGGGYDINGRPKILFERHYFHRITRGRYRKFVPDLSHPRWGGYGKSSAQWGRLMRACRYDPDAAFRSCSWGAFQTMGDYYDEFGHETPWDLALSMTQSEAGHYKALADYIDMARLDDELRALSTNPEKNRAFAKGYNGSAYAKNRYHVKMADAMRKFS